MSTELKGKVKSGLWNRPVCTDESEPLRKRQTARRDFRNTCRGDDGPFEVASADLIAEAQELGDAFPEE